MSRPLRIVIKNGIYHVMSRGIDRGHIVVDDEDRRKWVFLLGHVATQRDWRILAWALLKNHFHILVRVPHEDLSAGMKMLNSAFAGYFNKRHRRCGPLFQGRFKGIVVQKDYHYWELSRYIHLNAVRAGMVQDPLEYPWSSCRAYFDATVAPHWLSWEEILIEHGCTCRTARKNYKMFLDEGVVSPSSVTLPEPVASCVFGTADFVESIQRSLKGKEIDREIPSAREMRPRTPREQMEAAVCRRYGVGPEALKTRGMHGNEPRAVAMYLAQKVCALRLSTIGYCYGNVSASAVSNSIAKTGMYQAQDEDFRSRLQAIEIELGKSE